MPAEAVEADAPSTKIPKPSGAPAPAGATTFAYDAFATYATDPDRDLVRTVQIFVEGFHRRPALRDACGKAHSPPIFAAVSCTSRAIPEGRGQEP